MKDKTIEKIIPKLIDGKPMDYDLKPDGLLVVIDAHSKKCSFPQESYQAYIDEGKPAAKREKKDGAA